MIIHDIHTHIDHIQRDAIVSLTPAQYNNTTSSIYSVGIHPWDTNGVTDDTLLLLRQISVQPNVVAIGECGIDSLKGADIERQIEIFEQHILLSEQIKKPLIIHTVKSAHHILAMHRKHRPTQRWIIHGYRGNATTAQQYIERGIEISYGEKFNPEAVASTPLDMLWVESDESKLNIIDIYNHIAKAKNIETINLLQSVEIRAKKIFFECE